ncbi:MAG: zinc-dependent peptidase [Lentimonas sp.]
MNTFDQLKNEMAAQSDGLAFKSEWIQHLHDNIPLYARLPQALQGALHQKIAQFITTTHFEGCEGIELTAPIVLSVSGQACLLVLNHDGAPYSELHTVLLYPSAFSSTMETFESDGTFVETTVLCEGESWEDGTVRLAWDSVTAGARNISDGHNVTFHEFAHQLDALDGDIDGVPPLPSEEAFYTWAGVLGEHCAEFIERVSQGLRTVLDPYAATNPGEYFAVATETFFEKPKQFKKKHPDLYAELQSYYQLDPASWF